jgi:hypothetical protein
LVGLLACALAVPLGASATAVAQGPGQVMAGVGVVDATYHVGSSAGQYATTRDNGYGNVDPHAQQVKNQASYGIQARESVRALVVKGADGKIVALVSDDHYIPQDALWRRTAQLASQMTGGAINESNLTMSVTHNHSSPSYSSFDWGVWTFQDVFDFRFFDYAARQNAAALKKAYESLHPVRVSATVSYFDKFQRNPMGPGQADNGSPDGFPKPYTDHDLTVVRFDNVDGKGGPRTLATLVNIGQHPEDLQGYNLSSGEYPAEMERIVDRVTGGLTIFTQNAVGTSEVERDSYHNIHERQLFDHTQYTQMEWAATQLAGAVVADWRDIGAQRPSADAARPPYGGTSYRDRFVPWMTRFPVAMDDRWFPGPISHPYPGVSSCRTDPALQGNPRLPVVGLPDCMDVPAGDSLQPVTSLLPVSPAVSTNTFEALGIPIPENYSAPSQTGLEDTSGVHMQAFRLGDILFTVCSCEQWVEQAYNIKTRTDTVPGNEWLGYDPTAPDAHPSERCTKNGDGSYADDGSGTGTWTCSTSGGAKLSDAVIEHMRAQILNDASRWNDPTCLELGCGIQAESEPTDLKKVFGNFTHDDTTVRGGRAQAADYAKRYGYRLTVTVSMANDYNGYIASYREFMDHDHYRKALTGWGPHSSDYYATRLSALGHALKGDSGAQQAVDQEADPTKVAPGYAAILAKATADQKVEEAKVRAVGEAAARGVQAYDATLPNDGGSSGASIQPKDVKRFDAATFTWDGGNNYTDEPQVTVERRVGGRWLRFADQSGEVPVTLKYPASASGADPQSGAAIAGGTAGYRLGGQVWKWTATFEAFVSWMPLVDPQGNTYRATPAGTYRFVARGKWRKGGGEADYTRVSREFRVAPWNGITVDHATLDRARHVVFSAGPRHTITEPHVRRSETRDLGPLQVAIGPVDFPDTAANQPATGARFLNHVRGYSDAGTAADLEHYCLDCTFRPWLDSTSNLVAHITIVRGRRKTISEDVRGDPNGQFVSHVTLRRGDRARVVIEDAWGDTTGAAPTVSG